MLRVRDRRGDVLDLLRRGGLPDDAVHPFLEKIAGGVVALPFHVLAQGDADRSGFRRVGEYAHGIDQGGHQLFGPRDSVPVFAHRLERVVGGHGEACGLFQLPEHRVGLAGGKGIRRKDQQRDVVHRGRGAARQHVGRARADGRGAGNDLAPLVLLGEGGGDVAHALFVASLENLETAGVLVQGLPQPDGNPVAENRENAFDEFALFSVERKVLLIEKAIRSF
jgi:hypothetical protein